MPATVRYENPLIVQSDLTVLVEVDSPGYSEGRDALARFAELEKSPEHVHTYRITPLSIWNAASAGRTAENAKAGLIAHSKYDVPPSVLAHIDEFFERWGRAWLEAGDEPTTLVLVVGDSAA